MSPEVHSPIGNLWYLNLPSLVNIVVRPQLLDKISMVYEPKLISNAVVYWNNYSCCIVSPILGKGYASLTVFG